MRLLALGKSPAPVAGAAALIVIGFLPTGLALEVRLAGAATIVLLVAALQLALSRGPRCGATRALAAGVFFVWSALAPLSAARGAPAWFAPGLQLAAACLTAVAVWGALRDRRMFSAHVRTLQRSLERRERDVSAQADRIRRLSTCDQRSGLLNRRAFVEGAEQALGECAENGASFALLWVEAPPPRDHLVTDAPESLRHVAAAIQGTVRGSDLVARWDQRLFALLLPQCRDPQPVVHRLNAALRPAPQDAESGVLVAGVTVGPEGPWPDAQALLAAARSTLAAARRSNPAAGPTIWPLEWGLVAPAPLDDTIGPLN